MPHIAGLFVQPKIRHFDLDENDRASPGFKPADDMPAGAVGQA